MSLIHCLCEKLHNHDEPTQKCRRLSVAAQRWEQYKTAADRLAQEHAQRSHDIYHSAHAAEVARQHRCTLHAYYTNTRTAKTDYHMLVTKLIKDQMAAQRLHDTHTHTHTHVPGTQAMVRASKVRHRDVVCGCKNVAADLRAILEDVR